MVANFKYLQGLYKREIDSILAPDGLTTKCLLNYGTSKKNICINCIFDNNLKKSSNKYKSNGPVPFTDGMICPYCNGIGFYGESTSEEIYLAILWDNKKWVKPPINIVDPDNYIQTICGIDYLYKIKQAKDLTVILSDILSNPIYELAQDPTPAGLGDNGYLFCTWKKVANSTTQKKQEGEEKCASSSEIITLICDFVNKCMTSIIKLNLDCDNIDQCFTDPYQFNLICSAVAGCYASQNGYNTQSNSSVEDVSTICGQVIGIMSNKDNSKQIINKCLKSNIENLNLPHSMNNPSYIYKIAQKILNKN